jgi:1,4-dihydroxy-2-naphthoyl-CoA hydrolase
MAVDMANNNWVVTAITSYVIARLTRQSINQKRRGLRDTPVPGAKTRIALSASYDEQNKPGGTPIMTPLEKINSMKMPFAELKGVTFTEADRDRVVARMLVRPDLCTLGHIIHGGAIMAFADSVGAAATVINLPDDAKGTTTIESKTNFIGGAKEGTTVIAIATPVHRGRRTQVWQTRLETEDGKLVALVTQTQMVLV